MSRIAVEKKGFFHPGFVPFSILLCTALILAAGCAPSSAGSIPAASYTPTPTASTGDDQADVPSADNSNDDSQGGGQSQAPTELDVCALADSNQIAAVLGQTPISITPMEEPDEVTGGLLRSCTFLGQGKAVVISISETASPAAAQAASLGQLQTAQSEGANGSMESEAGLGDQASWVTNERSEGYYGSIGTVVFSVVLGGNDLGDEGAARAALLTLAQAIVARL